MQILNSNVIKNDEWYKEWRLVGAWVFFTITLFDFIGGPIMYAVVSIWTKTAMSWVPLTTQGGGLFYLAYGSILGISAYGKIADNKEIMRFVGQPDDSKPDDAKKD